MTGLVGHWPLHEQSGQANDLSGNGNHGSLATGITQGVAGRGGLTSYSFSGADGGITVPHDSVFNTGPNFSVCFWYYDTDISGGGDSGYVIHGSGHEDAHFQIFDDGELEMVYWDSSGSGHRVNGGGSPKEGEWGHAVFTVEEDGGSYVGKTYRDGELVSTVTNPEPPMTTSSDITIGNGHFYAGVHTGRMCDVRLYNRALSASEVQTLYEWGSGDYARPPTDGVAYYPLDGDVTDSWGGNDGTNNGVTFSNDSIRGQAGSFDGSSTHIDLGSSVGISGSAEATWSLWANITDWSNYDSLNNHVIAASQIWGTGTDWSFTQGTNAGELRAIIEENGNRSSVTYSTTNLGWHHLTAVYSGSKFTFYVNGVSVGDAVSGGNPIDNDIGVVTIGAEGNPGHYFKGNIDDFRIYDRALAPHEVHELYRWGTRGRDMRKQLVKQ